MHFAHKTNRPLRSRAAYRRAALPHATAPPQTVQCNLDVIPVRLDRSPGEVCWLDGCSIDVSGMSLTLMINRSEQFPGRNLVVGASLPGQTRRFMMLKIHSQQRIDGVLRIDACQIKNPDESIFAEHSLAPRIDAQSLRFMNGCDDDVLMQWEAIGVLRKYLVDRVLVCPDCRSLPTWRYACQQCGSARYSRDRLIHHFACAHVDHAEAFQSENGELRCPKCQATRLIAGTDFQLAAGPLTCFDCNDSGCQPVLHCMCHQCLKRFEPSEAKELELYGYYVDRLELLDLVAAPE